MDGARASLGGRMASSASDPKVPATVPSLPAAVPLLGHAVHPVDQAQAATWSLAAAHGPVPRLVVTLNPELVVRAKADPLLKERLTQADLTVADGVGLLWAARRLASPLPGRVPGVELAFDVMAQGGASLRVYFLGGRPGVAEAAAAEARRRWGVVVAGARDGYFDRTTEGEQVAAVVGASGAQLLLAGLGEDQEVFLDRHRTLLGAGAMIGVGGSLDVLAGTVKRSPAWSRRLGLEWALRVGLDPKRWHRIPRLLRFAQLVLAEGRSKARP